ARVFGDRGALRPLAGAEASRNVPSLRHRMTARADTPPELAPLPAPHASIRRTAIFLPLFAPFGISSGYVGVTLAFLLGRSGLSTLEITTIIAGTLWVQTWKVLWAPIVDTV